MPHSSLQLLSLILNLSPTIHWLYFKDRADIFWSSYKLPALCVCYLSDLRLSKKIAEGMDGGSATRFQWGRSLCLEHAPHFHVVKFQENQATLHWGPWDKKPKSASSCVSEAFPRLAFRWLSPWPPVWLMREKSQHNLAKPPWDTCPQTRQHGQYLLCWASEEYGNRSCIIHRESMTYPTSQFSYLQNGNDYDCENPE